MGMIWRGWWAWIGETRGIKVEAGQYMANTAFWGMSIYGVFEAP